ncbi:YaaR family protein [Bacillaceae bacterium W0354]
MKISQELRSQLETGQKSLANRSQSSVSFQQVVQHEKLKMHENELNRLLHDITKQGDKLASSRTFKDLAKYKNMVKKFIQEAVQYGLELDQKRSWNMNGDNRQLILVKQIDEKLIQLTDDVLDQEKQALDVLDVIGEIKGLLVNLYV